MWCTSLHLLQEPDATRAQPRPQATVVQRSRAASTQLPAETRPSGKRPHYRVPQPRCTAPGSAPLSSSYLKSDVVVIDINGRFECLRVAPRAAICPLETTNQFHVPLPLVIALLLPFPAISSCNLRAVLLADECLRGWSEAALVEEQSSRTHRVSRSERLRTSESACNRRAATNRSSSCLCREPRCCCCCCCSARLQPGANQAGGERAARGPRTEKRIRKGAALAYSASRIA